MRNITIILLLLGLASLLSAQQIGDIQFRRCNECGQISDQNTALTYTYGPATSYSTRKELIADDYGPRDKNPGSVTENYNWHKGIDFNSQLAGEGVNDDRGDLIISIDEGSIHGNLNGPYKWLGVDGPSAVRDFGYGHLFRTTINDQQSGNCHLLKMIGTINKAIICTIGADTLAFGNNMGIVDFKGDTLTVVDTIAVGNPIGPTGDSAADGAVHLHFYCFLNGMFNTNYANTKNPLQYISTAFSSPIIPEIEIEKQIDQDGEKKSKFMLRLNIPISEQAAALSYKRYNNIFNVEEVHLLMKNRYNDQDYSTMKGNPLDGKIVYGGVIGGNTAYPGGIVSDLETAIGTWSNQGIRARAYTHNPYDDFFFTDLRLRLHKTNHTAYADCPEDAYYPEGDYFIGAERISPRGFVASYIELDSITIDNFKPFIQSVKIDAGQSIYHKEWECNNGCISLSSQIAETTINYSDLQNGMTVEVRTSELVENLTMNVATFGIENREPAQGEGQYWEFNINQSEISGSEIDLVFSFSGNDTNGNELISFTEANTQQGSCVDIPTRNGNGVNDWDNPDGLVFGADDIHRFYFGCGDGSPNLANKLLNNVIVNINSTGCFEGVQADIISTTSDMPNSGSIDLTIDESTVIPPLSYSWDNGETTQDISGLSDGTYCVTITDDLCCEYIDCYTISTCDVTVSSTYASAVNSCDGSIEVNIEESTPPYTITLWDDGEIVQTITGSNSTYTFNDLCETEYEIDVESEDCIHKFYETIEVCNPIGIEFDFSEPCPGSYLGELFYSQINGTSGDYTVEWNTGSTASTIDIVPGTYCLTVTDSKGCIGEDCIDVENEEGCSENDCYFSIYDIIIREKPCLGNEGGAIYVSFDQGAPNVYSYLWSNGETTGDIEGLVAGTYTVTVTYTNGCTDVASISLEDTPSTIPIDYAITGPSGPNASDGEIDFTHQLVQGVTYTYSWSGPNGFTAITQDITNISPGIYQLTATGDDCTQVMIEINVEADCPSLIVGIEHHGFIACPGNLGQLTVWTTGEGVLPYTYQWSNGATTEHIENLPPGDYSVIVTDGVGCTDELDINLYEKAPIQIDGNTTPICTNDIYGSIDLMISGGNLNYDFQWSNGATTQNLSELNTGEYCVTVTDGEGCTAEDCFTINEISSNFEILEVEIMDDCIGNCTGSISVPVNSFPTTATWSGGNPSQPSANVHQISDLCGGDYSLTLTNSSGCVIEETFTVPSVQNFTYEVVVNHHFLEDNGPASVSIYSDQFAIPGEVSITETGQEDDVLYSSNGEGAVDFSIPFQYHAVETFHFTYESPSGCMYEGTFDGIPVCVPNEDFVWVATFVPNDGNTEESCAVGQEHSFLVELDGPNFPYYIEVTMADAFHDSEAQYTQTVEYNGESPFYINGIPAGIVNFQITDNCGNNYGDGFYEVFNCCMGSSSLCDIQWEYSTEDYDIYDFPYFRLQFNDKCYGGGSNIDITVHDDSFDLPSDMNCWTGTVTIEYGDGSTGSFLVEEGDEGDFYDQITWNLGSNTWHPSIEGTYFINIYFEGTGDYEGDDCSIQDWEFNWYGDTNYNDAVGFRDYFWFNNFPSGFDDENVYNGVWRCEACTEEPEYIFQDDIDECEDFGNWQFTFFDFVPNDYDNPCNGGGTMTIMDFDDNGNAIIQTIEVAPNTAIAEYPGEYHFQLPNEDAVTCEQSGWCVFDAIDVYGSISDAGGNPIDKALLATWKKEPCEVIIWNDPVEPNPDPCFSDDDCPPGYGCHTDGNCYETCEEEGAECFYGVCQDGLCMPEEDGECFPPCPVGLVCEDNNCYLDQDFCGFYVEENGGGTNTYQFYHGDLSGTEVIFEYKTLTLEDQISISGAINEDIACVSTGTSWVALPPITMGTSPTTTIHVDPTPCSGNSSRYRIRISCPEGIPPPSPPTINFDFTNAQGEVVTSTCIEEAINISVDAQNEEEYWVRIREYNFAGIYLGTVYQSAWAPGPMEDIIDIEQLIGTETTGFQFTEDYSYEVMVVVRNPVEAWVSHTDTFSISSCCGLPATLDFHFEDTQGNTLTDFAPGETVQIIIDAEHEESHSVRVREFNSFDILQGTVYNTGSTPGEIANITDLEQLIATQTVGFQFTPAYSYEVLIVVKNDCTSWKSEKYNFGIIDGQMGIGTIGNNGTSPNVFAKDEIFIYPNPSTGVFIVEQSHVEPLETIDIFDSRGKLVQQLNIDQIPTDSSFEIDLTQKGQGLYLFQFTTVYGNTISKKVMLVE